MKNSLIFNILALFGVTVAAKYAGSLAGAAVAGLSDSQASSDSLSQGKARDGELTQFVPKFKLGQKVRQKKYADSPENDLTVIGYRPILQQEEQGLLFTIPALDEDDLETASGEEELYITIDNWTDYRNPQPTPADKLPINRLILIVIAHLCIAAFCFMAGFTVSKKKENRNE